MTSLVFDAVNSSAATTASTQPLRCRVCKSNLTNQDKQKTTANYWKSCKRCRDYVKNAAIVRKMRVSAAGSTTDALPDTHEKKRKRYPEESPIAAEPDQTLQRQNNTATSNVMPPLENASTSTEISPSLSPFSLGKHYSSTSAYFDKVRASRQKKEENARNKDAARLLKPTSSKQPIEKECSICAESLPVHNFTSLTDCNHDPDVCQDCFLQWLNQRMVDMETVICPSSGCSNEVTHADVRKYASENDFTRFDELSMRSFLSADDTFLYCLAKGCPSGQIHDTGVEGPIFRCAACGYRMCTAHNPVIPFHENEACTQYDERIKREIAGAKDEDARVKTQKQEEASAAEVAKSSVECPGCGVQIQKTAGCDLMTCSRQACKFKFCYICRAPYYGERGIFQIGNSAHAMTCRYHPRIRPFSVGIF